MTTRARRTVTALVTALGLALAMLGFGSASEGAAFAAPGAAHHPAATEQAAKRPPHWFSSPSKNIGCYVTRQQARCDIARHTWHAPPKPRTCHLDWGNGLYVTRKSHWVCAGDTVLGSPRVLPYGYYVRFGPMKCISRTAGMTCRNLGTRHGFRLARDSYVRF